MVIIVGWLVDVFSSEPVRWCRPSTGICSEGTPGILGTLPRHAIGTVFDDE